MLPKSHRLSRNDILKVKNQNHISHSGRFFSLNYLSHPTETKLGVVISTKIAKRAVDRNRLRRLFYRSVGESVWPTGHWLFFAHQSLVPAPPEELAADLNNFLLKILSVPNP